MYDHYFSNFDRPPIPNDLCKDSAIRHYRFWRRRFLNVFTIYGQGGHLGQWTATILAIFHSPRLHMKFEQNWLRDESEEKSFENVNGRMDEQTDDGQKVVTIAHPEHSLGELISCKMRKRTFWYTCPTKTQISICIHTIWAQLFKTNAKNIRILCIESAKTVNEMTLNELI